MDCNCDDDYNSNNNYTMWHEDKSGEKHMNNYICDQKSRITWTTLTTTKRERGRETMMRKREKTVRRREHTPGPSSQAETFEKSESEP